MLHGEPGTGKTLLARAIAGEAGVPFIATSGSGFGNIYVNSGSMAVRDLFDKAKAAALKSEKKTAIVFIDEIDAIGRKRDGITTGSNEDTKTLNALLNEMDGFKNNNNFNIIVLGATNRLDVLDSALTRPGRFDDTIEIPKPSRNENARYEILQIHARKKPFESQEAKEKY